MACRWRIRHKLLLGFGLVIAIIGLLLAGTFYGLWSYRSTRRMIDSKLAELNKAEQILFRIKDLSHPNAGFAREYDVLKKNLKQTRQALSEYQSALDKTVEQKGNAGYGQFEKGNVEDLSKLLDQLDKRLNYLRENGLPSFNSTQTARYIEDGEVKKTVQTLVQTSKDLISVIFDKLEKQTERARIAFWNVLYWVVGTSVIGVLLLAMLFRRFYCWIVYPIRDLQQGVERITQGDFAHRVKVTSDDEMEGLAARFNHMTDELQALYTDLERQVNERSRQLVRSERLASVGFLAAGVAHEINNPLASIAFCSEALEGRLQDVLTEPDSPTLPMHRANVSELDRATIAKYVKMIQDEAFRCKEITQKLLEFSRGGDGSREQVDLNDIIQSVLDLVQHLPNGQDKHLNFRPTGAAFAWVNAHDIKSVVLNLVVNALDSMEEDGALTITHQMRDGKVEIKFKDTGCGMTPEVLENIFEPFYTRSKSGKGTGLGLSISHRIITQHGGEIEAFSSGLNRGSTFVIRLPLKPTEEETPQATKKWIPVSEENDQPERRAA